MKLALFLLLAVFAACDGCGPTQNDYLGCAASCARAGVASVTWSKCVCASINDGGR